MLNVKVSRKGDVLTLEVDLSKEQGRSASGKTTIIATSSGNAAVPDAPGVSFGLNVFKK